MSKITPLMTSLHEGHKAEERLKCIDNMLFKKCEDTKDTIIGKSNKKREYIPMKFESKPIKVLVVQYRHFGSSEEMARTEWRVKRDVKSGVVFLPNDCTYEFGEVERVVITGSDSMI